MAEIIARIASLSLAAAFAWAALAKGVRFADWRHALRRYDLGRLETGAAYAVPVAEAGAAILLAAGWAGVGGALSLMLISSFSLAVLRARALSGDGLPCGCFGRAGARDYRELLTRNAVLGLLAAVALIGQRWSALQLRMPGPGEFVPAALVMLGLGVGLWTVWQAAASMRRGGQR